MHVGSLIEIYTTMFGWSLYNTFFNVLSISGFLYYPLFMALYKNWKEPIMSQDDKPASIISQRRMTYDVVSILLVFSFAIVPFMELKVVEMKLNVACTDAHGALTTKQTATGGSTGYTLDDNLDVNADVSIPALWWLVLRVSSGINQAVTSSFTCFENIKGLDKQLRNLQIKDRVLRDEFARFSRECFIPAKTKFDNALAGGDHHDYVVNELTAFFGASGMQTGLDGMDPYYVGSHFYQATQGFYNWDGSNYGNCEAKDGGCSFMAKKPVKGWAYNPTRDHQHSPDDVLNNTPGTPQCDEWWDPGVISSGTPTIGLKAKLLASVEADKVEVFNWDNRDPDNNWFTNFKLSLINAGAHIKDFVEKDGGKHVADLVIKRYAGIDPPDFTAPRNNFTNARPQSAAQALESGAGGMLVRSAAVAKAAPVVAVAGTATLIEAADSLKDFYVTMFIVKNAAPMIQAVLLMMIYGLMIFYFVISEYDIDSIITMIFLILAVRFFTSLWVFADYIDARLYTAMYPDISHMGSVLTQGINRYLLDMVLTIMYIAVPALFLFVVTLAGQSVSKLGGGDGNMSSSLKGIKTGSIGKLGK